MAPVCKYPRQIAVIKRKKLTLSIEANFELAGVAHNSRGEEYVVPPLTGHGPRSCFKWTLIDTSGVTAIYPSANIPFDDVATFSKRVDAVIQRNILLDSKTIKKEDSRSPAYTVKLRMREFKGRTPASILLEDGTKKEQLLNVVQYLRGQGENSRYREANEQQINAIEEAVSFLEKGILSEEAAENGSIVIYNIPQKILENRPAKGETKEHYFVYSFKIECLSGYEYPWQIQIHNSYCKIKKMKNETIQTIPETAILKASSSIMLTDYEMGYIKDQIVKRKTNFEQAYFPKMFKESVEQERMLREYLKSNPQDQVA